MARSGEGNVVGTGKTVLVTGANGFIASHIVKQLLEKDYTVHGCIRDASNISSVRHLKDLPNADRCLHLFTTGDLGDTSLHGRFNKPLQNCCAVFHAATPLSVKFGSSCDGERDIFRPAMSSTEELLDTILSSEEYSRTVDCFVLTSSMSAVAPQPEPPIKDESHWSDPESQQARGNWYGCTKTRQEQLVQRTIEAAKQNGTLKPTFRYAAICPTVVLGPVLSTNSKGDTTSSSPRVSGTMSKFLSWISGGMAEAPNDSLSFIHVEDCASMHINAMELPTAYGRYMSLAESLHWNDIFGIIQELYPAIKKLNIKMYEGDDDRITTTQFNLDRMKSLGVNVRSTREILASSLEYLESIGAI